jgi:hypothetical protein
MAMTSGGADQQENKVPRPVADMWQSMQLSRKVDANTQGVSKVSPTVLVYFISGKFLLLILQVER